MKYDKKSFAKIQNANQDILRRANMEKVVNFCQEIAVSTTTNVFIHIEQMIKDIGTEKKEGKDACKKLEDIFERMNGKNI